MCPAEIKRWEDIKRPGSQAEPGSFLGFESSFKGSGVSGYPGGPFNPLGLGCVWLCAASWVGRWGVQAAAHLFRTIALSFTVLFSTPLLTDLTGCAASAPPHCAPAACSNSSKESMDDFKWREIRNGRLAMMAFLGFVAQHAATGKGPIENLAEHVADPWGAQWVQDQALGWRGRPGRTCLYQVFKLT